MNRSPHDSKYLGGRLLASVSRSFYLSIKVLPPRVREPLGLAYLLARTTDTVADTAEAPAATRLHHLDMLAGMLAHGPNHEKISLLQHEIVPPNPSERELLARLETCLDWLQAQSPDDRADIEAVLEKIIHGQRLDIERFQNSSSTNGLQNASELDEYTYLVAGCVGEFWTRICCRHLRCYSKIQERTLSGMGMNFGKGLQLVNILRDMPADLRAGRCYLPADELALEGVDAATIMETPALARPVFDQWLAAAARRLDDGFFYIEALTNWRIRFACILPWFIGVRTLVLLVENFPLTAKERVKVSRSEVKSIMAKAPFAAMSNKVLRGMRAELKSALKAAAQQYGVQAL